MPIIDLQLLEDRTLKVIIDWAKTNKGYSDMRDLYIHLLDAFTNSDIYFKHDEAFCRLIVKNETASLKKKAAPSLTKAQQHKLSVILRRISDLVLQ